MSDNCKPNLLIHPRYVKTLLAFDLDNYFNIIYLHELKDSIELINPFLVSNSAVSVLTGVVLNPTFNNSLIKESGIKPQFTSNFFDTDIPIYKITNRAPRYVIWNTTDDLTVCATCVDRMNEYNLYEAYRKAKDWAFSITKLESIIVFDLDETLIDRKCKKLKFADELLKCARLLYDKVVLYSHGSNLHVDDNVTKFNSDSFDLVLSNNHCDKVCQKNLLYLYNYFPNTMFKTATLVDDSLYNWTPEYDKFIVPYKLSSLHRIISLINI